MFRSAVRIGFCLIAAAAVVALGGQGIRADTGSPTPTPATVPAYSSTITIRNFYRAIPLLSAPLPTGSLSIASADGQDCGRAVSQAIGQAGPVIIEGWPWHDYLPCNEVGVPVQICVRVNLCADFTFAGHDATVDLNWPAVPDLHTVTAHFTRDGISQPVTLTSWSTDAGSTFNGQVVSCGSGTTPPVTLSDVTTWWYGSQYCAGDVNVRFTTAEYGELTGTFNWTGGADVDYDVVVPAAAASASPSPVPTAAPTIAPLTPAALPSAGGPSANADGALALLVGGLAAMAIGVGGWLIARRRPRPGE